MFDYQKIFDEYCRENGLALRLCVEIPEGRKQFRIQNGGKNSCDQSQEFF